MSMAEKKCCGDESNPMNGEGSSLKGLSRIHVALAGCVIGTPDTPTTYTCTAPLKALRRATSNTMLYKQKQRGFYCLVCVGVPVYFVPDLFSVKEYIFCGNVVVVWVSSLSGYDILTLKW
ncbi:hypothetical protein EYF80_046988 [Liparis tanakae]|uniref:Uncharacterized protein n=1 Tax=Liparis tanakae TaxID=230148 RepID=A0A4Z2FNW2_9TELE|nr:hypothetical protein EYF80_046988 [Liparis tanakae]